MTEATTPTEVTTTVDTGTDPDPILGAVPGAKEDVTTSLYRAAIGPMCVDFYLPIFSRFEAAGKPGLSWNSAASLLTLNWLLFRQLWTAALAYVGILATVGLLVFGIGRLVFQMSDEVSLVLLLIFGLAAFIAPGLLGNMLLHKQCRARMEKALADNPTLTDAISQLQRQASSRLRLLWLALGNLLAVGLAALVYMQMASLTTVAAMPQGAAEARQTVSGLATDANGPLASASAAAASASAAPVPVLAPALTAASAPNMATSEPASAVSAAPVASAPSAPVVPVAPAQTLSKEPAVAGTPPAMKATEAPPTPPASSKPSADAAKPKNKAASAAPKASAKADAASAAPAATATAPAPAAKATAEAPPKALFYINVGLFSKPENASRVHAQLLEANMPSVMKELKTTKARQIRVRVGPYATEEKAEAAAQKIKAMQFEAGIIQK
jgi:cell division protein FtsN